MKYSRRLTAVPIMANNGAFNKIIIYLLVASNSIRENHIMCSYEHFCRQKRICINTKIMGNIALKIFANKDQVSFGNDEIILYCIS